MALDWQDFLIEPDRGNTCFLDWAVTVNKLPQPITGWTIWFTAKRRLTDSDAQAVIQKSTVSGGVTISNAAGGLGFVTLQPADTTALVEARLSLWADLKAKDGAGQLFTLAKGRLTIRPIVTEAS
jgi:hypothetical protein